MPLAVSTHWNARAHTRGESLVEEILDVGVRHVELGYDLTADLVPGVLSAVSDGSVTVTSVHNFCPVPPAAPAGHPELFALAATDARERQSAVRHTADTVEFAARVGASCVVAHAGYVGIRARTADLVELAAAGHQYEEKFDRLKLKLMMDRESRVRPFLEALTRSIEELLPTLERCGTRLAFENLPAWESVPAESEMEALCRRIASPRIGYWHDTGHAQIRQNLGFISARRWLERLGPFLFGLHVHSVEPPAFDHLLPPRGRLDTEFITPYARRASAAVLEPAPGTPASELRAAIALLTAAGWSDPPGDTEPAPVPGDAPSHATGTQP